MFAMKRIRTFSVKLAVLALVVGTFFCTLVTGCHDNYWTPTSDTEEVLTISVPQGRTPLRAGKPDPALITNDISFLFFDNDAPSAPLVKLYTFTERNAIEKGSFRLKLVKKNYFLIVVTNLTPELKQVIRTGVPLESLTQPMVGNLFMGLESQPSDLLAGKNFYPIVSSNAQGLVPVVAENFGDTPQKPLTVQLAVARARISINNYPRFTSGIKDLLGKYYFATFPHPAKKVYLMRPLAMLANGNEEKLGDGSTPIDRYTYSFGYKEIAEATDVDAIKDIVKTIGFTTRDFVDIEENAWVSKDEPKEETYLRRNVYRNELTTPPNKLLRAITPHLLVIYRLCPESLILDPNEGWISYQGHYMREKEFRTLLSKLVKGEKIPKKGSATFPPSFIPQVQSLLAEVGNNYEDLLTKGFTKYGIRFYYRAQNYYLFPIRHFSNEQAPTLTSYGRYGMVRNNDYKFNMPEVIRDFGLTGIQDFIQDYSPLTEEEPIGFSIEINSLNERPTQSLIE